MALFKKSNMIDANEIVSSLLNMAAKVEHATAGFYFQISKNVTDEEAFLVLQKMATNELEHEDFFSDLRLTYENRIKTPIQATTWQSISKYASAVQDSRIFDFDFILNHVVTGSEETGDVIRMAIGFEKDSIVFYAGLANIIEDNEMNKLLKEIIREEFNHLSTLINIDFL